MRPDTCKPASSMAKPGDSLTKTVINAKNIKDTKSVGAMILRSPFLLVFYAVILYNLSLDILSKRTYALRLANSFPPQLT